MAGAKAGAKAGANHPSVSWRKDLLGTRSALSGFIASALSA